MHFTNMTFYFSPKTIREKINGGDNNGVFLHDLRGDTFRVKPNELLYLLIEGTKIEDSYLTFMRNCILGGNTFRAFRGDRIQKGTLFNFTLIDTTEYVMRQNIKKW